MRKVNVSPRALKMLVDYAWPGNVRELRNVLERAMLLCEGREIQGQELRLTNHEAAIVDGEGIPIPASESEIKPLTEVIAMYAKWSVEAVDGNMRRAARRFGISPSTLYSKVRKGDVPH